MKDKTLAYPISVITYKDTNLCYVICFEMNTASITNITLLKKERGSSKFIFSLKNVTFYWKKISQLFI